MYEIIMRIKDYAGNAPALISTIAGCVLATLIFAFVVGPIHNFIKYRIIERSGDNTPVEEGLLTISPRGNVHIVGAISALVLNIGFAPAVVYDDEKFERPTLNIVMFSLAGLFFYAGCAVVCVLLFSLISYFGIFSVTSMDPLPVDAPIGAHVYFTLYSTLYYLIRICAYSFVFNIIPFVPLDFGDILYRFLSFRFTDFLRNNDMLISLALFVLSFVTIGRPGGIVQEYATMGLNSAVQLCYDLFNSVAGLFG